MLAWLLVDAPWISRRTAHLTASKMMRYVKGICQNDDPLKQNVRGFVSIAYTGLTFGPGSKIVES
jgi:hypothetical protein